MFVFDDDDGNTLKRKLEFQCEKTHKTRRFYSDSFFSILAKIVCKDLERNALKINNIYSLYIFWVKYYFLSSFLYILKLVYFKILYQFSPSFLEHLDLVILIKFS